MICHRKKRPAALPADETVSAEQRWIASWVAARRIGRTPKARAARGYISGHLLRAREAAFILDSAGFDTADVIALLDDCREAVGECIDQQIEQVTR